MRNIDRFPNKEPLCEQLQENINNSAISSFLNSWNYNINCFIITGEPEAEAHGVGQDACQIKGTPCCAHSSADRGAVPRGRASSRRDGEGLPHWVWGQHAPAGEADDLK